jgi:hypothetical protein
MTQAVNALRNKMRWRSKSESNTLMAHQSASVHEESADVIPLARSAIGDLGGAEVSITPFNKEKRFFEAQKLQARAQSH